MSKFYLVSVTKDKYKHITNSESLEDVLYEMKRFHSTFHTCSVVVRDGSTGKRYPMAYFFDAYGRRR